MSDITPGAYHTDMLSALMNETLDEAGAIPEEETPASLHREVALLRGILDQANVWLDVLDSQGNVVLWNQAAEDISGYTREEVVGHGRIWDWLYPDSAYRQEIIKQAASIIDGNAVQDFETTIQTKDGETRIISWYSRDITSDEGEHIGSIALGRDITDRRQAEQALEESEQRYRTIVEHAHEWIWTLDREGRLTFANRAVQQGTGYDFSEQAGAHFSSFIHPDDLPHIRDVFEQTLSGNHSSYNVRILDSEGRTIQLEVSSVPRRQGDEIVGTIAFARDVTEQAQLEDKLQESEERYRAMVEQSHDAVAIIQDESFLFVNARLCELTGYSQEAFDDMNISDILHPGDRERLLEMIQRRMQGEATQSTVQARLRTERGDIRHGEFSVTTIFYGGQTAVLASIRDVTERRRIEQRLRESEQRLRDLMETTSDCIWEMDTNGIYTFVSGRVEALLGYTSDELIGTSPFALMPESEAQRMRQLFMEKTVAGEPLVDVENRNVAKNGDEVIMLTNAVPIIDDDGIVTGYRGIDNDVTARRQAEREIQESEKRYRTLVENLQEGMGIVDPDENIIFANPAFCDILGYTRDDLRGMNLRDLIPGQEFQHILQETGKRKQGASSTYETVMQRRDGELRDVIVSATPLTSDGEFQGTIGLIVDVTEHRRAEREAQRQQELAQLLLNATHDLVLLLDIDGTILTLNEAMAKSLGTDREKIIGTSFEQYIEALSFDDQVFEERRAKMQEMIQTGKPVQFQDNRQGRWFATRLYPLFDDAGTVQQIAVFARDITERKQMEEALRAREKRYRDTVDLLPMPYGEFDREGNAVLLNQTCLDLFQYTREEFKEGLTVMQVIHPDDRERAGRNIKKVLQGGTTTGSEYRFIKKDGTLFPCRVYSKPIRQDGDITGFKSVLVDITERKKMEQELRESEEKYSTLVEQGNDGIMIVQDYKITYCNQKLLEITGYAMEEIQDSSVLDYVRPQLTAVVKERYEKRIAGEDVPQMYELEIIGKDGRSIPVEVNASVITYRGEPADMAIVRDITERKQMEQELKKNEEKFRSLAENATDGIYQVDENDAFVYVNDVYCEILGYTEEELLGEKYTMIIFDEDIPAAKQITRNASEGTVQKGEFTLKTKNGDGVPVHFSMGPRLVDGNKCGFSGIIHDITRRRQMEQQLEQLREEQQILLDTTPAMIFWIDRDSRFVRVNQRFAATLDMTPGELVGTSFHDLYPAAQAEKYERDNREVMQSGEPKRNIEETVETPEGTRWFSTTKVPYRDDEGNIQGVIGFSIDITERKQAEEELRQLGAVVEQSIEGYVITDLTGRISYINRPIERLYGYTQEELYGQPVFSLNAESVDTDAIRQQFMDTGSWSGEVEQKRKDGSTFPALLSLFMVKNEDGEPDSAVASIRDITERKQMEQKLRESEDRYRRLVEASPDSIIHVGLDGRILTANDKAAHIHGFASPEDMIGQDAFAYVAEEDRQRARENMQRVLEEGLIENIPYTFLREDGTPFLAELSVAAIYDERGNPTAFVGVTRDVTEQKKMEEELRASEEKFRRLAEQSFEGIYTMDWRGVFTYVSPGVRHIAGYEPEEVEGTFFGRYIRKRDLPKLLKAMVDLKRGRAVKALRYGITRKDGTVAMVEANAVPIFKGGKSVGIQGSIRDVTERQEAEERYRRLIEASPELIAEADEEGRFVTVNPAMARALGSRPEELVGRPASEVLPEDVLQQRMAVLREVIEQDTIVETVDERAGRVYHNIVIPLEVAGGGHHVQLIARDITERKKIERALKESEEKFRSIFQHAPIGMALVDIEGRPVLTNPALRDMLGYSEKKLASMPFPAFTHPDDVEKDLELYKELQEGKRDDYSMQKRYIREDGSILWGNLTVSVIRGEDGEPLWGVGMVEDVTERRRAEEERQRQEQLAALGRIAAVVSHELNTPLANIALAADCLASGCDVTDSGELDVIRREVDNASAIVKQVLGFSRMDEMDLQPTDLASVVTEAVDAVRDTTPFDGAIDVSVATAGVLADEHQLYRAFVNLVNNAVLARDPDKESHHVTVTSETTGSEVVVTIADTGVGMDSEVQAQADTPFFTTRPPGEGTGLGLYIARWIIERHGGTIEIESEPGQGTTVTVTLPLRGEQA